MASIRLIAVALCIVPLLHHTTPALGWSTKEHIQMTRITALHLIEDPSTPGAMKQWLRDAAPGLLTMGQEREWWMSRRIGPVPRDADGLMFWAVMPDMEALMDRDRRKVEPFDVPERLLHYIDLEYFGPQPPTKPTTRPQPSGPELLATRPTESEPATQPAMLIKPSPQLKPTLADVPRSLTDPRLKDAGMLPHRVQQSFDELVRQLRAGRLIDEPGQYPRDDHAARWAGYLAHYAQDNTQPHHATVDYKSRSFLPSDLVNPPDVHAMFEYGLGDGEHDDLMPLRSAFWDHFRTALTEVQDPVQSSDPFDATVEVSLISYDALDLIGQSAAVALDRSAPRHMQLDPSRFYNGSGEYRGRAMSVLELKAHQMAWAVVRTKKLWRAAWDAAHTAR
jgi:hypothetical protein